MRSLMTDGEESEPLLSRHCQERAAVLRSGLLSLGHSAPFFPCDPRLQARSQRQKAALLHQATQLCESREVCVEHVSINKMREGVSNGHSQHSTRK